MKIEQGTSNRLYTFNEYELAQHDLEVRKPLEYEIERLKKENKQLIKDNRLLDKTKYTAQQDGINFFVSEERQKVIAELEE